MQKKHNPKLIQNLLYPLENRLASYLYTTISWYGNRFLDKIFVVRSNLTSFQSSQLIGPSFRRLHEDF